MNKFLIPVFAFVVLITSCHSKKAEKEEQVTYTVTNPMIIDTTYTKEYVAQIQSVKNIELRAQEKGFLESIKVDEGRTVKAGQTLFKIMPKVYEAEMYKAEAEVKQSEQEFLNTQSLNGKGIVSDAELKISKAKLDGAKADLELAKIHLSFTDIKAPFDGVINRIPLKIGSLIDEGALLTTLSDNRSMYAYFNVPEAEYLNFKKNVENENLETVELVLANGDIHKHKGNVETIEGEFDKETGNIAFRAEFPNPELLLKHGESGKVRMKVPVKNAIIIPQKATYEIQDKVFVYVVTKDNIVKSRMVQIKYRLQNIFVIDSGLQADDRILVDGLQLVKEDDKINCKFQEPKSIISNLQLTQ